MINEEIGRTKIIDTMDLPGEGIEILSVDLLNQHRTLVEELKSFTHSLGLELGWHYLLDLTWIISRLDQMSNQNILDAGAGTGVLQWYLAQGGASVFSVDRQSRENLPLRFRRRFRVEGLRQGDLRTNMKTFLVGFDREVNGPFYRRWLSRLVSQFRDLLSYMLSSPGKGKVIIYNQDLADLKDVPSGSIDAVVSVSALEHNTPEGLIKVVAELFRVLKPGGFLLATLVAGRDTDTWHEPSQAWCYHDSSLRRIFDLSESLPSNYSEYDHLFSELRHCAELSDNLARFYFRSGSTGMPWGKWDPQYLPVGICKIKH